MTPPSAPIERAAGLVVSKDPASLRASTLPWGDAAKVAVVMPTRNQARFLAAAVESILSQEATGLRLWVQDGASQDGTVAVLNQLSERYPTLAWASEPDGGPAQALNLAMAQVLKDPEVAVVGWLNSDDLLAPGALGRVLAHLSEHPDQVAVYGEGEHVDVDGRSLGRYPTGAPDQPLSNWADGCPICQPTVWLRREAVEALWPLDTSLRTAFDFEAWLRLWKRFPDRIGRLHQVQAFSRLHEEGITLSQRRRVALESMAVIRRHIGPAPSHWLLTCANELMATWPDGDPTPPLARLGALLAEARPFMEAVEATRLSQHWRAHRALALGRTDAWLDLEPDGWLLGQGELRLRPARSASLQITGRHSGPLREPLHLQALGPQGQSHRLSVPPAGVFNWRWPVEASPQATQHWRLQASPTFVPAQCEPGSQDRRALACQITSLHWRD